MPRSKAKAKQVPRETVDLGTEQTRQRLRRDPVAEMAARWRDREVREAGEMETAAREIRRIYTATVAGLMPKAVDMNGVRGVGDPMPVWLAQAKRDRYDPWAKEMSAVQDLPLVMDWLIDEVPLTVIDASRRQRKGSASTTVTHALTRYAQIAGWIGVVIQHKGFDQRGSLR